MEGSGRGLFEVQHRHTTEGLRKNRHEDRGAPGEIRITYVQKAGVECSGTASV
jgi:hypothetical protein